MYTQRVSSTTAFTALFMASIATLMYWEGSNTAFIKASSSLHIPPSRREPETSQVKNVKSSLYKQQTTYGSLSNVLRKPAGEDGCRWRWRRGIHP